MQQQDIVQIGRLVGAAIIVIGVVLAIWNATDLAGAQKDDAFRYFVQQSLTWFAWGGILIMASEVADRLGTRRAP